jgi:hypothetical protein
MRKLYPCMVCEKRYAEIEQAEVCEQSHTKPPVDSLEVVRLRERCDLLEREGAHGWCDRTIQELVSQLQKCTCGARK